MKNQPHANKCGAKTRSGTACKNAAMSNGRCRMHGGKSSGPINQAGNKNAVKTGEHEAIWLDTLEADELELFNLINLDKTKQVNNEIKLTEIRERRMLQRIQKLKENEFTVTKIKTKETALGNERETEALATLGQIQSIEEALTRIQNHKAKLIELKHKLEMERSVNEVDNQAIKDFFEAMKPPEGLEGLFKDEDNEIEEAE